MLRSHLQVRAYPSWVTQHMLFVVSCSRAAMLLCGMFSCWTQRQKYLMVRLWEDQGWASPDSIMDTLEGMLWMHLDGLAATNVGCWLRRRSSWMPTEPDASVVTTRTGKNGDLPCTISQSASKHRCSRHGTASLRRSRDHMVTHRPQSCRALPLWRHQRGWGWCLPRCQQRLWVHSQVPAQWPWECCALCGGV